MTLLDDISEEADLRRLFGRFPTGVTALCAKDRDEPVGMRIQTTREIKLFRQGRSPVLRGTALTVSPRKGYLWTVGFVPDLQTYPGREAPNPLSIEVTKGDADLTQVMQDVLGLTKLNFNACIYGDGTPVTLRFADDVGEILTAAPIANLPPLPFKHYI